MRSCTACPGDADQAGKAWVIRPQDYLADRVGAWVTVIIGVISLVCVLAFRKGIVGELLAWQQQRKAR